MRAPLSLGPFGGTSARIIALEFATLLASQFSANADDSKPAPLTGRDFQIGPINSHMSTKEIRAALGPPSSVTSERNPIDPDLSLVTWHYRRLEVSFMTEENILGIAISGKGWSTFRGLRIGDPESQVKKLYGEPTSTYGTDLDYHDPSDSSDSQVMRVTLEHGHVSSIFVGTLLD